jgi:hypothetical protein
VGEVTAEERLRHIAVIALAIHFLAKDNSAPGARQIERFAATITGLASGEPRFIANKEPEIQEVLQAAASVVANRARPSLD